jgi:hypothetical protein
MQTSHDPGNELPVESTQPAAEPLEPAALDDASGGGLLQWIKDLFTDDSGSCGGGGSFGGGGASGSW